MATLDLRPHKFTKVPGTLEMRQTGLSPYVRLCRAGETPLYVQGGRVYGEGGPEVDQVPTWVLEDVQKLHPRVRDEVGADRLLAELQRPAAPAAPEAQWTCPEDGCGQTMPRRKRGFHVAGHRRKARTEG